MALGGVAAARLSAGGWSRAYGPSLRYGRKARLRGLPEASRRMPHGLPE